MQIHKCIVLHMDRQTPYFTVANFRQYLLECAVFAICLTYYRYDPGSRCGTRPVFHTCSSEQVCVFYVTIRASNHL